MSTPPLELMPCAGLANRMRAIASGLCAAEDTGCAGVKLVWKFDRAIFTAPFHMVFDMGALPSGITQVDEAYFEPDSSWLTAYDCTSKQKWADYVTRMGSRRPYRIKSWAVFYEPEDGERWLTHLRSLRPHPDVLAAVDESFRKANLSPTSLPIGVHIRRTDHTKAIQGSPSAAFWAELDALVAADSTVKFYIASDDETERQEALRRYPDNAFLGPHTLYGRNDPYGCRDAMVDLVALSRCQWILGSEGSSFSEIAAAYGNTTMRVARG